MLCRSSPLSEAQSARPAPLAPGAVSARIGTELGCSDWITVSQDRIDRFAECIEDRQFIHIDPERASQTPFGGPIAHGFLSLGLLSAMAYDALPDITGQSNCSRRLLVVRNAFAAFRWPLICVVLFPSADFRL